MDGPGQGGAALGGIKGVQGKTFGELRRRGREGGGLTTNAIIQVS